MKRTAMGIALAFLTFGVAHAQTADGKPCTTDCSGRDAGYKWAQTHDIADEKDCKGKGYSQSFIDGCKSYIEENTKRDPGKDDDEDEVEVDAED